VLALSASSHDRDVNHDHDQPEDGKVELPQPEGQYAIDHARTIHLKVLNETLGAT
jgi:hypothetical protein